MRSPHVSSTVFDIALAIQHALNCASPTRNERAETSPPPSSTRVKTPPRPAAKEEHVASVIYSLEAMAREAAAAMKASVPPPLPKRKAPPRKRSTGVDLDKLVVPADRRLGAPMLCAFVLESPKTPAVAPPSIPRRTKQLMAIAFTACALLMSGLAAATVGDEPTGKRTLVVAVAPSLPPRPPRVIAAPAEPPPQPVEPGVVAMPPTPSPLPVRPPAPRLTVAARSSAPTTASPAVRAPSAVRRSALGVAPAHRPIAAADPSRVRDDEGFTRLPRFHPDDARPTATSD